MEFFEDKETGVVVVALRYGDGLLESLREVAQRANIHTGVVISGIGSLRKGHIHTVVSNKYPPTDEYIQLEPEVPVELPRVVFLDDEAAQAGVDDGALRLRRLDEVALLLVLLEAHGTPSRPLTPGRPYQDSRRRRGVKPTLRRCYHRRVAGLGRVECSGG